MGTALSIILTAIILGILITIHELGHFTAGKLLGFEITEFAIGMGPKIFKKHKGGTDFVLRAFPIGGMCKFVGEDEEVKDSKSFNAHPVWKRMIVVVSGAFMNIVLALFAGAVLFGIFGSSQPIAYQNPQISDISVGAPSENSQLMAGDFVVAINGESVENTADMIEMIKAVEDDFVDISVLRTNQSTIYKINGIDVDINDTDKIKDILYNHGGFENGLTIENTDLIENIRIENIYDENAGYNRIGVSITDSLFVTLDYGFFGSFGQSGKFFVNTVKTLFEFLGQLFTGKADVKQMMGIIGIVDVMDSGVSEVTKLEAETATKASILVEYSLLLLVLLSINLGVVNLLPFPALDGGRVVFMLIEAIFGKPVPVKIEAIIHMVGFFLLMALIVLVLFNDVLRMILR